MSETTVRVWPKTVKDQRTGKRTDFEVTTTFRRIGQGQPRLGDWVGDDCPMAFQSQVHTGSTYTLWEKVSESERKVPKSPEGS